MIQTYYFHRDYNKPYGRKQLDALCRVVRQLAGSNNVQRCSYDGTFYAKLTAAQYDTIRNGRDVDSILITKTSEVF